MATETVSSAPPEEVEKEEVKKMEAEKVCPPPKESVKITKPEESPCPSAAESEAKIEDEKVAVIQDDDLKETIADEEPKAEQKTEDKPCPPAESTEAKVDDKPVELPPTVDDKCTPEVAPIVDKGTPEVTPVVDKGTPDTAEPTIEKEDIKSKQGEDTNKEKPEETENVVDVPELSPAAVIEEIPKESPAKPVEDKDVIVPEAECKPQEPAPVVEDKIHEKIEKEIPEPEVEDTKLAEKEETCAIETSEAPAIQLEEKHVDSNPICEVTERAKDTVEVIEQSEEKGGKNETGVAQEKSVVAEELAPCEEKATEDAKDSVPVSEKVGQDEAISTDIEPVCDKGNKEDDETTKKVDETEEAVKQVDEKIEETPHPTEEKQVNEAEKTDVQNQECTKDSEDTKTYQDVRKEDVPVKKQSFVKIVKQSLVKAKKAIIGKSQNPKTPVSEPKDDGNK